jgi:hypothetical protein
LVVLRRMDTTALHAADGRPCRFPETLTPLLGRTERQMHAGE